MLLGNAAVGKSSLLLRFASDMAPSPSQITPTIGAEFKVKTISLPNRVVRLKIWDTSGQKRYVIYVYLYISNFELDFRQFSI